MTTQQRIERGQRIMRSMIAATNDALLHATYQETALQLATLERGTDDWLATFMTYTLLEEEINRRKEAQQNECPHHIVLVDHP